MFLFIILTNFSFSIKPSYIKLEFREKNHFFTIPITVGSKKQPFEVQVDTTTCETWLPSINTTFKVDKFDPKTSSTCEIVNKEFEIDDEDGNVRGTPVYDSVTVGPYTLDRFGFVVVQGYQSEFKDFPDGKLGLGGDAFSTCDLVETNDLDDVFRAGWVCELTHIFFGVDTKEKNLEMALQVDARVIFDSAYDYISFPKRHLNDFNKKFMQEFFNDSCIEVKDDDEIYFICDDDEKIKEGSIAFLMGGFGYVVPWNKLFKQIEEDKYEMLIRFHKENDDIFSFGYPFTSQFVIVYNAEDKQLGFYGGEKIDLKKDWDEYMAGESPIQKKEKIKKLLTYGGIFGGILLCIIICLVIRSKNMKKSPYEARSMLDAEQVPQ